MKKNSSQWLLAPSVCRVLSLGVIAFSSAFLFGCGGGTNALSSTIGLPGVAEPLPPATEILLLQGNTTEITGRMTTNVNLLKTVSWSVSPYNGNPPPLLLFNLFCPVTSKIDKPFLVNGVIDPARTGSSDWTCNLGVTLLAPITTDAVYSLVFTGKDDLGASTTQTVILRVTPKSAPPVN